MKVLMQHAELSSFCMTNTTLAWQTPNARSNTHISNYPLPAHVDRIQNLMCAGMISVSPGCVVVQPHSLCCGAAIWITVGSTCSQANTLTLHLLLSPSPIVFTAKIFSSALKINVPHRANAFQWKSVIFVEILCDSAGFFFFFFLEMLLLKVFYWLFSSASSFKH